MSRSFYLDLFSSLARHDVRYLLVGGLAMNLYGVPRMTMDVDILLALNDANLKHFFAVAAELKLRPVLPVPLQELADPSKRQHWVKERKLIAFALQYENRAAPSLDVLIGVELAFDEAYPRRNTRLVGDVPISLAAMEDIITLKTLAGRAQDLADIEHLRRL
ncbi:MAG: nucleotidyl transferase AbiEii/AbiGii toxin family protein [Sulfuricellaceae bacterium]|nr:nucleotidyl transferase AbiEii/AbiGii toxin family protein [Sulfuricellaceae bacterium]